jgi:hypothetical protein
LGDYNLHGVEGAVTVPISEAWSVRVAGQYGKRDRYLRNLYTGRRAQSEDAQGARITAAYAPDDRFKSTFFLDYVQEDPSPTGYRLYYAYPGAAGDRARSVLNLLKNQDHWTIYSNDSHAKVRTTTGSNVSAFDLTDKITFKNIAGYR